MDSQPFQHLEHQKPDYLKLPPRLLLHHSDSKIDTNSLSLTRFGKELLLTQKNPEKGDHGIFLVAGQAAGRIGTSDADEQYSQITFGQTYIIKDISESGKGLLIQLQSDSKSPIEFWLETHKHIHINVDQIKYLKENQVKWPKLLTPGTAIPITGDPEGIIYLPPGSILPFYDEATKTFCGPQYISKLREGSQQTEFFSKETTVKNLIDILVSQLGWPYDWGGTGFGIDCSGFVKRVFDTFLSNVEAIPRDAKDQKNIGQYVAPDKVKSGDIICYSKHIGILALGKDLAEYAGKDLNWNKNGVYLFHARQLLRVEELRPNAMTPYMNPDHLFIGIKRIIDFNS